MHAIKICYRYIYIYMFNLSILYGSGLLKNDFHESNLIFLMRAENSSIHIFHHDNDNWFSICQLFDEESLDFLCSKSRKVAFRLFLKISISWKYHVFWNGTFEILIIKCVFISYVSLDYHVELRLSIQYFLKKITFVRVG